MVRAIVEEAVPHRPSHRPASSDDAASKGPALGQRLLLRAAPAPPRSWTRGSFGRGCATARDAWREADRLRRKKKARKARAIPLPADQAGEEATEMPAFLSRRVSFSGSPSLWGSPGRAC